MLILAATPIGNLQDISPRLARTLERARHIYAEDTRHSQKLLNHLGLSRRLESFHEHSPKETLQRIGALLQRGDSVVYLTDAGMPGVSDPGYELVRLAHRLDMAVDVLPGPSAVMNALVLSGLPCHEFCFLGFFPEKPGRARALLERLSVLRMTTIFFEAPSRISFTLALLQNHLPGVQIALCREMTKVHQQVLRGNPGEVAAALSAAKGEMALVIGPVLQAPAKIDIQSRYLQLLAEGQSPSRSVRSLAREHRLSKREILQRIQGATSRRG